MACCGNRPTPAKKAKITLTPLVNYKTNKTVILCRDGVTRPLAQLLIKSPGRPAGGWKVNFSIAGQQVEAGGQTAAEVYQRVEGLYRANSQEINSSNIWLNLNLDWMNRTEARYHMAGVRDLLAIATGEDSVKDPKARSYTPKEWGRFGWMWLGLWLAKDSWNYRDFLMQCRWVLDMLNPDTNPSLGCVKCYTEFTQHIAKLEENPQWTQENARMWLFTTHNEVSSKLGKVQLTYAQAAKANFWT